MKLTHVKSFNLELGDDSELIISKAKGVFEKIDPNFKKWGLNEDEGEYNKKQVQSLNIIQLDVKKSIQMSHPYLYVKAYPLNAGYFLFQQKDIVSFCKKCRDLLVGENKMTLFYSRKNYETFIVEVISSFINNKAQLEVRPLRLGDSGMIIVPTGGLQIFVIEDGFFTDGTKSSDIWRRKK
jgi:hypothetical protein